MTLTHSILTSTFTNNGQLGQADGSLQSQFLILGAILAAFWLCISGMFAFYLNQFRKSAAPTKLYGRAFLTMGSIFSVVILVSWILILVFVLKAQAIFDPNHTYILGADDTDPNKAFAATLAFIIIGFVTGISFAITVYLFLPRFGMLFDDEKIMFIGEGIKYKQIVKIIHDEQRNAVFINYTQGKQSIRKQKFALSSVFGQFVLQNAHLTGKDVVVGDEMDYYKQAVEAIKSGSLSQATVARPEPAAQPAPETDPAVESPAVDTDAAGAATATNEAENDTSKE